MTIKFQFHFGSSQVSKLKHSSYQPQNKGETRNIQSLESTAATSKESVATIPNAGGCSVYVHHGAPPTSCHYGGGGGDLDPSKE
jgi:hypothetical protein